VIFFEIFFYKNFSLSVLKLTYFLKKRFKKEIPILNKFWVPLSLSINQTITEVERCYSLSGRVDNRILSLFKSHLGSIWVYDSRCERTKWANNKRT